MAVPLRIMIGFVTAPAPHTPLCGKSIIPKLIRESHVVTSEVRDPFMICIFVVIDGGKVSISGVHIEPETSITMSMSGGSPTISFITGVVASQPVSISGASRSRSTTSGNGASCPGSIGASISTGVPESTRRRVPPPSSHAHALAPAPRVSMTRTTVIDPRIGTPWLAPSHEQRKSLAVHGAPMRVRPTESHHTKGKRARRSLG